MKRKDCYNRIKTEHKTINKTLLRSAKEYFPTAVRRSNVQRHCGNTTVFFYNANGDKLGWYNKSGFDNVEITVKSAELLADVPRYVVSY